MSSKLSSLFRSKSETPSPRRTSRTFGRILSPARSKHEQPTSAKESPPQQPNPDQPSSVTQLPLDPHTSPASNLSSTFDAPPPLPDADIALASREHDDEAAGGPSQISNGDFNVYSDYSGMDDEREMKRKLMDMESSFIPDFPLPESEHPPSRRPHRSPRDPEQREFVQSRRSELDASFAALRSSSRRQLSEARPERYKTQTSRYTARVDPVQEDDEAEAAPLEDLSTQSTMQHSLSSPSAAAAQRSRLRAAAIEFSPLRNATTLALVSPEAAQHEQSSTPENTLSNSIQEEELRAAREQEPQDNMNTKEINEGGLDETSTTRVSQEHRTSLEPPKSQAESRPRYSKDRQSSQRSSASSYLSNEATSELAGVDSGGGTPGSLSTVRAGHELSRLPSLGSVASGMSVNTERSASHRRKRPVSGAHLSSQENNLAPVAEDRSKTISPPETPQITVNSISEPRETVVARHVRDVEVPATVARNYKAAQAAGSTVKSSNFASPNFGRAKNDLTLKEQNSRIDKLSKENFDLKLKIHYLYQALQDRSDEGVKDLISKNAQLSTDIIKARKENQSLRKRLRELERELRGKEDGLSAARTVSESEDMVSSKSWQQAQLEDEISYLRDRMQAIEEDNERLRQGDVSREFEKRRMANQVKSIVGPSDQPNLLKDELEQERSKRERAEQDAHHLRLEVSRLRTSRSPTRGPRLHPQDAQADSQGRPVSKSSGNSHDLASLSGTTAVDQLKQENADLRRDLGAQTSMLTSRNRERERLQQEIEDLKLLQRRGDGVQSQTLSVSGDSVLDRSVSRNNFRPNSRASASGKTDQLSEGEKDKYESKQAALRDENATLRMRIQDLQSELDMLTGSAEHLENLRNERDEALLLIEEERDFAADTIDRLEEQAEHKDKDITQLLAELRAKEDESKTLEQEIRDISASLSRVADESETSHTAIQDLQQDLAVANGELEAAQFNLQDAVAAKERLEVQAESSQGEIAFLREEQEADKIKISDLQSALTRAKTNLRDEKERLQEFEEMEAETRKARDEARRIRKALSAKEEEMATHRESLEELEDGLRQAIGSTEQNRSTLLKSAGRLRRDLEEARADLEQSQGGLEEKHQRLQDHIMLLEASEAERQRLANMLEREEKIRRQQELELERAQPGRAGGHNIDELEEAREQNRQRLATLEDHYTLQVQERNKLLYNLWTRLAALCGSDWLENFSAKTNQEAPTFEMMSEDPNSIDAPISLALDTLSQTLSTFRARVRSTEKDMYKDLEALSYDLDTRSKRIDALERTFARRVENGADAAAPPASADLNRLKDENRLLRRELKILKQGAFALPGLPSPQHELDIAAQEAKMVEHERDRLSQASPTSHRSRRQHETPMDEEHSALQRHPSSMNAAMTESTGSEQVGSTGVPSVNGNAPALAPSEQRWILRLEELRRRLKTEQEGRLLDRDSARKRLEERDYQIGGLRRDLKMEKERKALVQNRREGNSASN